MTKKYLDTACDNTSAFMNSMPKAKRKKYGQFFTSRKTAGFMSSLFVIDYSKPILKILDAGSGTGILTCALVENLRDKGYEGEIIVTCYENDLNVLLTLTENLNNLKRAFNISYRILTDNYITSQYLTEEDLFGESAEEYDMVIGNPPYLKVPKDAPEALAMPEVCYGAPNLYFLFWAMGIKNLKENGELVYIIPRSWTSGAYFESFRQYLFKYCAILNMHIFESRDKVFDGESVLQETMIIKIKKTKIIPDYIMISSSETSQFEDVHYYKVAYDTIVAPNKYVFIVTNEKDAAILSRVNRQKNTLDSDNLRMRTGLIVDFRTKEVLRNCEENGTFPLFFSHHIKNGRVTWPIGQDGEYILTERDGFLQENSDYLFVKRFTSKEEKRRLQCGIYLESDYSKYKYISTQNKINYIKCDNPETAYGLYVLMNSTLYDSYYRILNGSTQVNSTEINAMPVPSKDVIKKMGEELIGMELTEQNCNNIVDKWIK